MFVQHGRCTFGVPKPKGWRDQLRFSRRLPSQHVAGVLDFLLDLQVRRTRHYTPTAGSVADKVLGYSPAQVVLLPLMKGVLASAAVKAAACSC